ncbi:MAG: methyltransferase domain-containing protein [Candidatus Hodarchaeota archaeon]
MKAEVLNWICCPKCKYILKLENDKIGNNEIKEGKLTCICCNKNYKIHNFIPRFVDDDSYASNFSLEWQKHRFTQLDEYGLKSEKKETSLYTFYKKTGFNNTEFEGKLVLDAGVGAGRFADIAEKAGAIVVGFDLSYSVDAAYQNFHNRRNIHLIQADLLNLPLRANLFDLVYSIGVLSHIPDPKKGFVNLVKVLKNNGKISIWVFDSGNQNSIERIYRKVGSGLRPKIFYRLCNLVIPFFYIWNATKYHQWFWHAILPGFIFHLVPKFSSRKYYKWRVLDTFDFYSANYFAKLTYYDVFSWFRECKLQDITINELPIAISAIKNK